MTEPNAMDGSGFKQDVTRLGQGVGTLTSDVGCVAHEIADVARSGVAELQHGAVHAVDIAKHKLHDAQDSAAHTAETLKHAIAKHPVTSVGIAAGVGMLVGLILFRPRS